MAEGTLEGRPVVVESERLDLDKEKATLILARALFNPDNVFASVPTHRAALLRFTANNRKAQRCRSNQPTLEGLHSVLIGMQLSPGSRGAADRAGQGKAYAQSPRPLPGTRSLSPLPPSVSECGGDWGGQALYEADVVEEETFIEWSKKGSKKFVSKEENKEIQTAAAPFIKWLEEAEEESDDEDGDEADVAVPFHLLLYLRSSTLTPLPSSSSRRGRRRGR